MHYTELDFSPHLSRKRIQRADTFLGTRIVQKILAFALYLLGAKVNAICSLLEVPEGTFHSLTRALRLRGLAALEDRRSAFSDFKPAAPQPLALSAQQQEGWLVVGLGDGPGAIRVPAGNRLQARTLVLTLLGSGLLSRAQAAQALGLSEGRAEKLARQLERQGAQSLLDRRQGQAQEYRFTPQIKGEMVQQFVLELAAGGSASAKRLAEGLKERCGLVLSPRGIADQLRRLGLDRIKGPLAEQLAEAKKNSPRP